MKNTKRTRTQVLVIEPSQVLSYAINSRLPALLPGCNVICVSDMGSAAQWAGKNFQGFIVLSTARHDTVQSVRDKIAVISRSSREALMILYAERELMLHDLTIAACANKPSVEELANAVKRLLSEKACEP